MYAVFYLKLTLGDKLIDNYFHYLFIGDRQYMKRFSFSEQVLPLLGIILGIILGIMPNFLPPELPLPQTVLEAYDQQRSLLLLGAPGGGKTTQLLELAATLLARAEHDEAMPIAVVLSLTT